MSNDIWKQSHHIFIGFYIYLGNILTQKNFWEKEFLGMYMEGEQKQILKNIY